MAKWVHRTKVLDAALNVIKTDVEKMIACSSQPATYAQATTTYALALDATMTDGNFTIADGTSGHKVTVSTQSGLTVDTSGTANHVALVDTDDLLYVTTCTQQSLTAGNTVDFGSWKIEIGDPT